MSFLNVLHPKRKFLQTVVIGMGLSACEARADADVVEFKKLPTEAWSAVIPPITFTIITT